MNCSKLLPRTIFTLCLFLSLLTLPLLPAGGNAASRKGPEIVLYSYGPAMIQLVSPEGLRVGQDMLNGSTLKEISNANIVKEQIKGRPTGWTISLPAPATGLYRLKLTGTGKGGVVLDLDARDRSGKVTNSHIFKRIREGDALQFSLSYNSDPGSTNRLEEVKD